MGEIKTNTFFGSIVSAKHSRLIGVGALAVLFAIFALVLVPVCKSQDDTFAAPTPSTTTLAMTTPSVSLSLALSDATDTFAVSDPASFSVTTNNYTGYALSIRAKEDNANNSKLINGSHVLNSISIATADSTGFSVGDWGYKPSKIDSADNTDFLPAPTYEGSIINATNSANSTADAYSLAIAAKADYTTITGTYFNTFVLTAVPNPVNYTITYDKNTTDTVTNMPAAQIGTLSDQDIIISSTVPSRAGYDFGGWCDGNVTTTTCSGTKYNPGAVYAASMQTANTPNLKAIWNVAGTARAILGSNGNLNFVYDSNTYTVGDTYTDNLGSTTISAVYDVPTNSSSSSKPAWAGSYSFYNGDYRTDITSVNFTQSFSSFKPTSTVYWFFNDRYISTITNASNLNTSNVTNMSSMFYFAGNNATTFSLDLSSWNVSNVTNMNSMLANAGFAATTWSIGNLSSWDVSKVTNMSYMFSSTGYKATTWSIGNLSSWDVSKVTNMSYMFSSAGLNATYTLDLRSWNVSKVTTHTSFNSGVTTKVLAPTFPS